MDTMTIPRGLAAAALAASTLMGCMTLESGVPPRVDRLASLTVGQSTPSDILQTLGEPRGKGMSRMTPDLPARDIWVYEHMSSDGKAANLKILMVFLYDGRYDGHFWFGSNLEIVRGSGGRQ
jgi:hypothetical protein